MNGCEGGGSVDKYFTCPLTAYFAMRRQTARKLLRFLERPYSLARVSQVNQIGFKRSYNCPTSYSITICSNHIVGSPFGKTVRPPPLFFSLHIISICRHLLYAGGYDYAKTSAAAKGAIMAYICFGVPLFFGWLLLHGKTVAQTWLLTCVNAYRLLAGLRKRFRSVSPGTESEDGVTAPLPSTMFRPELSIVAGHLSYAQLAPKEHNNRVRVVSVGTPQGTTVVVNRQALTAASAALFGVFLLYVLIGAGASTSSGQTMFDGLFWIFLQFTTTSSNPYATFGTSPGARGGWALYYAVGALQLAALSYMAFMLATWRCAFCANGWTTHTTQA
ncbi:uncharacterized protein LOC142803627 [Rhipicephalus microplus]|uniref:uncharacterized protein LOC142803627 n=1 Tax=Rhipicephalus microplus TaxID=6941 RepID=UPI003F6D9BD3